MKKFTCLIIPLLFTLLSLVPNRTSAQTTQIPGDQPCSFTYNDCVQVGFLSVTPSINQPGGPQDQQLDVEIYFQDICGIVSDITINQVQGRPIVVPDSEISETVNTVAFQVNANSFNDGLLRVEIGLGGNDRVMVTLAFAEEFECGAIIPLPVELTSFKGKATESGIALNWETASELNNSHFDIERSTDGESFNSIGTVQGRGTTSIPSSYSFVDELPGKGTNYYRLKQVDYDNAQSYSSTIAVKWDAGDAMQAALIPNPCANSNCNITVSNAANQSTLLQLKDVAGRVVFSRTINSSGHLFELPMHELPKLKGLYFLTATTGNQVVHQRVVLE
ncbi:T9SS type A sorting domain-containing protein [Pontibacter burrus]|uniref:T9SS type A sorting domain-containing protein n=1 Tax=Pontibacter burrus TaxID=2704466 RepID=A0A6B3LZ65_9BACT|nr:T9SS type A sorting domain-containing protein [Pontibacter burrus]NEM99636.1 T9SS type A sorting domain-containing protein [Pontibacter burrus]